MTGRRADGSSEPTPADVVLRTALSLGDRAALEVAFERHGAAAFRVAMAITGEADRAADAVATAFVGLCGERPRVARSLRVDVLDAARRAAGSTAAGRRAPSADPVWGAIADDLTPEQRDVLALAVPGESSCTEIAAMLGTGRDRVHHVLRSALAGVGASLGLSA